MLQEIASTVAFCTVFSKKKTEIRKCAEILFYSEASVSHVQLLTLVIFRM